MKTNLVFFLLLTLLAALPFSTQAVSVQAALVSPASEKLAESPAVSKQFKKEKRWKKRLARLENKLQKMQERLVQKSKSGGRFSLGFVGLFVLALGGLFVLLGLAIPIVGILFIVIGGIVGLVGLLLMAILGGISVDA